VKRAELDSIDTVVMVSFYLTVYSCIEKKY